uniref:Gustatory receptor n=1 Tax=Acrobeloides nanus TaxID=290746 RepID=A0A914CPI0_9BILA
MVEEDSQILKLIRDPMFPKLTYLVVGFVQLIIFATGNFYNAPALSTIVSILTLLTSLAYFTYALAFACFHLMAIPATLYDGRYALVAILGGILMVIYLIEAYMALTQIDWHRWENINEDSRKYVRFLKFVGRFPVLTNMLIAILSAVLIVVARLTGSHEIWNNYVYSYSYPYHYSYSSMTWDKFTMFFAAGVLFVLSLMNIMTMKFKCIQYKLDKNIIQHYKIKYIFTYFMMVIALVGFSVSFGGIGQSPFATLVAAVVFLLSLFMALSEAHAKWDEPNSSDDLNTILPTSLPKNILNPVVTDELKTPAGLDGTTSKILTSSGSLLH